MTYSSGRQQRSRMVATEGTPWISVSLLAEHTYCPRAGVIQHESQEEDVGDELIHVSRGRVRRYYTLGEIQRDLSKARKRTLWMTGAFFLSLIFSILFRVPNSLISGPSSQQSPNAAWLNSFSLACCCGWAPILLLLSAICGINWASLYRKHYLPAIRAVASVPDPEHTNSRAVHWWALLKAGFEPRRPNEPLRDARWRLVGCPWRVLVAGDLRIPVFRKRSSDSSAGKRLYRQHYARMAAYCHLLEACEGAESPYGIVMLGNSYDGITVPNQPGTRKTFHDALVATRKTISALGRADPSAAGRLMKKCLACPHSWRDRHTGQSVCGERFHWRPPNTKSDEFESRW